MDSTERSGVQQQRYQQARNAVEDMYRSYRKLFFLRRGGMTAEELEGSISDATVPKWLGMWNDEDFIKFIEEELF